MRKIALPHPQINKDNGCRLQMDGEFLPLLQTEHLDDFPEKQRFLIIKGLVQLISFSTILENVKYESTVFVFSHCLCFTHHHVSLTRNKLGTT